MTTTASPAVVNVEEYFSSLSGPAKRIVEDVANIRENYDSIWNTLDVKEQEQILDENIIHPEAVIKYQHVERKKPEQQVFPRLRIATGRKQIEVDEGSGAGSHGDLAEACTLSYLDEHSAPFSWKTRSQQELRFESGRPVSITSEDMSENGLETLAASPSKILNRQTLIRNSKGNPCFAKAVQIPQVPTIPKPDPPVKPQENTFVLENSPNRIVLDFGTDTTQSSSSPESVRSSQGLLARVKERTDKILVSSFKKDLPDISPTSTLSSRVSTLSSHQSSLPPVSKVIKPSVAPPPPPVHPSAPPPPPPVSKTSQLISNGSKTTQHISDVSKTALSAPSMSKTAQPAPPVSISTPPVSINASTTNGESCVAASAIDKAEEEPLKDFNIDLNTDSNIPKTGFDFLDNW